MSTADVNVSLTLENKLDSLLDFKINQYIRLAGCSLDTHPTKHNWVEDAGGLPEYICEIARAIMRGGTKDTGRAISIAVARCKVWAAGGGNVNADTRAKARAAIAEWEAKKAKSHAK